MVITWSWYCFINKEYAANLSKPLLEQLDIIPTNHFFACVIVFALIYPVVNMVLGFVDTYAKKKELSKT
ncbi:hypothetical protein ACFOGQ_15085 [Acinetobacter vivianii]